MTADFQVNPELTGLSLAYTNPLYIADKIFRRVPTETSVFKYREYEKDLTLQLPNDEVGESSDPNQVKFKSKLLTDSVKGYSLVDDIPQTEIEDAKGNKENLVQDSTEFLTNVFLACREKRLADMLGDVNTYKGNAKTVATKDKITNDDTDAWGMIQDAIDALWLPANTLILSRQVFSKLRRNPSIRSGCNKQDGAVNLNDLKELFSVDNILIGSAKSNTAKRGAQADIVNLWGNDIIALYINPTATPKKGLTFGLTMEQGSREISEGFNGKSGVRGVHYVKIAEQLKDKVLAPDCGYLLKNVI